MQRDGRVAVRRDHPDRVADFWAAVLDTEREEELVACDCWAERAETAELTRLRRRQAVNEDPQPQVVVAFGLRITNCAPSSPSR